MKFIAILSLSQLVEHISNSGQVFSEESS